MRMKKSKIQQIIKEEVENYDIQEEGKKIDFVNSLLDRVLNVYLEASEGNAEEAFTKVVEAIEDRLEKFSGVKMV